MEDRTAVTVIGLGAMGTALAGALLDSGRPTTVWNRTAAKADPLVAKGAKRADSAADAIGASPIVVICVLDDASAREVLAAAPGAMAGRVIVNLTNGTPDQTRATSAWAVEREARYLAGGIMAGPSMIGGPGAFVLYSGARDVFEEQQGLLEHFGGATYVGADPGLASLQDLALLSAMYGMYGGIEHAFAMVRAQVTAVEFAPFIASWLEAMLAYLPRIAEGFDAGSADNDESNLAMQAIALDNIIRATEDGGVDPELMRLLRDRMTQGAAQ